MKLANIHSVFLISIFVLIGLNTSHAQTWTLQQCIEASQLRNKNILMSGDNIDGGEQRKKEAKASFIPKISANKDYKYFANSTFSLLLNICHAPHAIFW